MARSSAAAPPVEFGLRLLDAGFGVVGAGLAFGGGETAPERLHNQPSTQSRGNLTLAVMSAGRSLLLGSASG